MFKKQLKMAKRNFQPTSNCISDIYSVCVCLTVPYEPYF